MKTAKLALKPYLEKIEQLCEQLGKEALTGLIVAMARQAEMGRNVDMAHCLFCQRLNDHILFTMTLGGRVRMAG